MDPAKCFWCNPSNSGCMFFIEWQHGGLTNHPNSLFFSCSFSMFFHDFSPETHCSKPSNTRFIRFTRFLKTGPSIRSCDRLLGTRATCSGWNCSRQEPSARLSSSSCRPGTQHSEKHHGNNRNIIELNLEFSLALSIIVRTVRSNQIQERPMGNRNPSAEFGTEISTCCSWTSHPAPVSDYW